MKKKAIAITLACLFLWHCDTLLAGKGQGKDKAAARTTQQNADKQAAKKTPPAKSGAGQTEKPAAALTSAPEKGKSAGKGPEMKEVKQPQRIAEPAEAEKGKGKGAPAAAEKAKGKPASEKGAPAAEKAGGKAHAQQSKALQKQLQHEEQKHLQRVARMERIRELAVKKGDDKTVERIDLLMQKEQTRYERKQKTMLEHGDAVTEKAAAPKRDTKTDKQTRPDRTEKQGGADAGAPASEKNAETRTGGREE